MHRPAGFVIDKAASRIDEAGFVLRLAPPEGGQFHASVVGGSEARAGSAAGRPVTVRGRPGRELNTGAGAAVYWEEEGQPYGVVTGLALAEALRVAESLEAVGPDAWRERLAQPDPGKLVVGLDAGRIVVVGQGFAPGERVSLHVVVAATEPRAFPLTADPDGRFLFRPGIPVPAGTTARVDARAADGKTYSATVAGPQGATPAAASRETPSAGAAPTSGPEDAVRRYFAGPVPGTANVDVLSVQPAGSVAPAMPVFRVGLRVRRDGSPSNWNDGDNVRWVLVRGGPGGWLVAEVASSPIGDAGQTAPAGTAGR